MPTPQNHLLPQKGLPPPGRATPVSPGMPEAWASAKGSLPGIPERHPGEPSLPGSHLRPEHQPSQEAPVLKFHLPGCKSI